MTPAPTLPDLVATVEADAPGHDPLVRLATATTTAAELTRSGDDLIGHFVERCREAGHSWAEISDVLGVSRQAAHKRFSPPGTPLERFTLRAREAFTAAGDEARALGQPYVGTEHLLLGLFTPAGSIAETILTGAGMTHDGVVAALVAIVPRAEQPLAADAAVPFTPRAMAALGGVLTIALGFGHNYIGTEHMLLALHREPEGIGARLLIDAGLDETTVRGRVVAALSGVTPAG